MRMYTTSMLVLGLAFNVCVLAEPVPDPAASQDISEAADQQIKMQFKTDREACNSLAGNAKDICIAETKGREKVSKAELEARRKDTDKNRYEVLVTKAEAAYDVAKERCDDKSGNAKDVCLKDAKAAMVAAKADATTKLKTAEAMDKKDEQVTEANLKAGATAKEARKEGAEDKQDADYAAAKERCDSLSGGAKDNCLSEAATRFHK